MEHELVTIPPFHRLPINSNGSLAYVLGNVPYLCYSEGKDDLQILMGQSLPLKSQKAEIWNPFSFAAKVQIMRGGPLNPLPANGETFAWLGMKMPESRMGTVLLGSASGGDAAGRRRGVGLIAKRGVYEIAINSTGGTPDTFEIMTMPRAAWQFMALRPALAFAQVLPAIRWDGSVNDQLVTIAGSYTQAEIDTWKASVGYTGAEIKSYVYSAGATVQVDAASAVFFTNSDAVTVRMQMRANELGDCTSKLREV